MEIGTEISQKIRSAIKAKLIELGAYVAILKKKKLKTTLDSFLKDVQWIKTAAANVKETNRIKLTDITSSGSGNVTEENTVEREEDDLMVCSIIRGQDDELPDYIMVMVANKRSQKQMTDDLSLFLSTNTEKFTTWLHGLLKKLQSINTDQVQGQSKPKHKEKHKSEKKKRKASGSSEKPTKTEPEKSSTDGKKEETKKQKVEDREGDGKVAERITSTVKTGDDEPATEISISENTDEFNEENKEVEKTEPSKTGKAAQGKKSAGEGKKSAAKSQGKTEKEGKKSSKKKPTSIVASVKRKYEVEEEEEEYDPLNPAVGNVASVIRGPTRKSSIPKSMQANRSLLMKAVTDAEKSISTSKKLDSAHTGTSAPGMKSDQSPVDVRKRLKTAAGLQLISRTKRKGIEDMTYTIKNDVKKPRKSSEGLANMKYTVKNVQVVKPAGQKKSKAPAVVPSRVAASALKGISQNAEVVKEDEEEGEVEEENAEGDVSDSERNSDESDHDLSDEMGESEGSEVEDEGSNEGSEIEEGSEVESEEGSNQGSEVEGESEGEYSVEEVEIEVTDRASQTIVNMKEANFKSSGLKLDSCDKDIQTDTSELGGFDVKLSKEKLRDVDSCLFHLFIDNLLPFEFVENETFKLFAKTLQPKYHFPKRKKLIAEIGMIYNSVKDDLKHDLSRSDSYTVTQNAWRNLTGSLYNSVSVHLITADWVLRKAVIRTSLLDENNLVDNMVHMLEETRLKWHLSKPTTVVMATDSEKSVFEMLDWRTVFCFGCCVQNIVRGCLEKVSISEFIQRGRDLIQAVQDNPQVADVFEKKKKVLSSSQGHSGKLKLDETGSDWSKTLDMIVKLTEQTPALHAAIMDTDLTNQGVDLRSQLYNFSEQSVLESLVKILSPFKTATDILTNSDGLPTIQKVIPTLIKLEKAVEKESNDSTEIEGVKKLIKSQIQNLMKANRDVYLLACLLHPQTKQIGFLSQEDRDAARALLFKEVTRLCEEEFGKESRQDKGSAKFKKGKKQQHKQTAAMSERVDEQDQDTRNVVITSDDDKSEDKTTSDQQSDESGNENKTSEKGDAAEDKNSKTQHGKEAVIDTVSASTSKSVGESEDTSVTLGNDWLDDVISAPEERKSPEEVAKIELDVYMAETASNKNPLSWWKDKCQLYPRISKVAKKILAIPASSLPSEDVYKLSRSLQVVDIRVKPEHVDMMMFLNRNKHLLV